MISLSASPPFGLLLSICCLAVRQLHRLSILPERVAKVFYLVRSLWRVGYNLLLHIGEMIEIIFKGYSKPHWLAVFTTAVRLRIERPSQSWGCYAARRCWPRVDWARAMRSCSNVPFITDVCTLSMKCAPLGDQRFCCLAVILRCRNLWTGLSVCAVEIGSPERRAAA